jgi:hypothetical protein
MVVIPETAEALEISSPFVRVLWFEYVLLIVRLFFCPMLNNLGMSFTKFRSIPACFAGGDRPQPTWGKMIDHFGSKPVAAFALSTLSHLV